MIPKKIHYCWFGRNPMPRLAEKCINSWRKYCPDYELIEWNEDNFDLQSAPLYVRQAYEAKKWAFVTDYVRLCALYDQGGIYMDTDVEVVRSLDGFLKHEAFSSTEDGKHISASIMGCVKGFPVFAEFRDTYDTMRFYREDGSMNLTTIVTLLTEFCIKRGYHEEDIYQEFDGLAIYPKEYFYPKDMNDIFFYRTKNTYTIHHFAGSWLTPEMRRAQRHEQILQLIIYVPKRILKRLLGKERFIHFKKLFGR